MSSSVNHNVTPFQLVPLEETVLKNNKWILFLAFVSLTALTALGQDEVPKFEVPVGFSFVNVHPNTAALTSFNVFGGGGGICL